MAVQQRIQQLIAAKPPAKSAASPLREKILKVLHKHGFRGNGDKLAYANGVLSSSVAQQLHADLIDLGLERSAAGYAWSWFNRDAGILVRLTGKTGEKYFAEIVKFT